MMEECDEDNSGAVDQFEFISWCGPRWRLILPPHYPSCAAAAATTTATATAAAVAAARDDDGNDNDGAG
eukprot:COSAG01_NODE_3434_length_6100_cov_7.180970_7_plen_69_part_00